MIFVNAKIRRTVRPYNRDKVLQYAHKWAYARNPAYYDFENLGGDCTNFASQCIFAGSGIMNYTHIYGWYYISSYNRTASWTGVNYLYEFLVNNRGAGPFAEVVDAADAEPGDIAQLSFSDSKRFDHSPVIVKMPENKAVDGILVAAHTFDTDHYRLMDFEPAYIRFLHIAGVRI
ncbi:MAG: amidase domain-containing protein [Clostridiaceae bacterium]|nr:amidase domain-containing protein [Clostridiaceae bacterium]